MTKKTMTASLGSQGDKKMPGHTGTGTGTGIRMNKNAGMVWKEIWWLLLLLTWHQSTMGRRQLLLKTRTQNAFKFRAQNCWCKDDPTQNRWDFFQPSTLHTLLTPLLPTLDWKSVVIAAVNLISKAAADAVDTWIGKLCRYRCSLVHHSEPLLIPSKLIFLGAEPSWADTRLQSQLPIEPPIVQKKPRECNTHWKDPSDCR